MAKIMVVDDDSSICDLLTDILQGADHEVVITTDGTIALEKFDIEKPDLIVTDLVMPKVTGLELCRLLKKVPATADIPIIACTTKDRKMDQMWAKKQGVSAYVVKPFEGEQLLSAIRSLQS